MNDTDYINTLHGLHVRTRTCIDTKRGEVQAFYVQLELNLSPNPNETDDWTDVARFDHQPNTELGHDITKEGLHMDLCHPTKEDRKITSFPHVDLKDAPGFCEEYFRQNYESICDQYADWYGIYHWDLAKNPIR